MDYPIISKTYLITNSSDNNAIQESCRTSYRTWWTARVTCRQVLYFRSSVSFSMTIWITGGILTQTKAHYNTMPDIWFVCQRQIYLRYPLQCFTQEYFSGIKTEPTFRTGYWSSLSVPWPVVVIGWLSNWVPRQFYIWIESWGWGVFIHA